MQSGPSVYMGGMTTGGAMELAEKVQAATVRGTLGLEHCFEGSGLDPGEWVLVNAEDWLAIREAAEDADGENGAAP